MYLASQGKHSDHSLINTSLQRGGSAVTRRWTALAVSRARWKNRWSGYGCLRWRFAPS